MEEFDNSADMAVDCFRKAREPGIYKEGYLKVATGQLSQFTFSILQDLYKRYADEEDAPPAPELPDWCFEEVGSSPIRQLEEPCCSPGADCGR